MDFVAEYKAKERLAKALRAKSDRYTALQMEPASPVTGAPQSGAYPGQMDVNYASPLMKLGAAFLNRKSEDKIAAAESDVDSARLAALQSIMGGGAATPLGTGGGAPTGPTAPAATATGPVPGTGVPGGGGVSPQALLQLQQLGIDPSALKGLTPKAPSLGAFTQAATTPEGRAALLSYGVPKEQVDAMEQAAAQGAAEKTRLAREQYDYEQSHKTFAPTSDKAPSAQQEKLDLLKNDPEAYATLYPPKSGGGGNGRYDAARESAVLTDAATQLESTIAEHGDEMFGAGQTLAAGTRKYGSEKPGTIIGNVAEAVGTKFESPANAIMRSHAIDATIESLAKLAPASDTDVRTLASTKANAFQNKESALAFIALMKKVAARYAGGQAPEAATTSDEEIDALMGGP